MNIKRENFFAALSHPMRLRALLLLQNEGELCVCDLTSVLGMAQPAMSRQLAILRDAQMVSVRREGLWMHYRINTSLPAWGLRLIQQIADDSASDEPYRGDRSASAQQQNGASCSAPSGKLL